MIIDRIENCGKYESVLPGLTEAFATLANMDENTVCGQVKLSGENFINVTSYETNLLSATRYEGHFDYVDIQYMIKGEELIDIAPADGLSIVEDCRPGDCVFYGDPEDYTRVVLTPGTFALIFPGEAHRPALAINDEPGSVLKAIAKVRLP